MKYEFRLEGSQELERALKQMPSAVANKVARNATRVAMNQVTRQARANAPWTSIKAGLVTQNLKPQQKNLITAVSRMKPGRHGLGPLAHLLEYGSGSYYTGGGKSKHRPYPIEPKNFRWLKFEWGYRTVFFRHVMHPGIKGTYFMARAVEMQKAATLRILDAQLKKGIATEWGRLAGKSMQGLLSQ